MTALPATAPGPMEASLRALRDGGRKLLVPYLTGGLGPWTEHLRAMADAGADVIEVGIPFSDPAMDGPIIQQASELALRQGATPGGSSRMVKTARRQLDEARGSSRASAR